jgi:hypothetical protein
MYCHEDIIGSKICTPDMCDNVLMSTYFGIYLHCLNTCSKAKNSEPEQVVIEDEDEEGAEEGSDSDVGQGDKSTRRRRSGDGGSRKKSKKSGMFRQLGRGDEALNGVDGQVRLVESLWPVHISIMCSVG